MDIPPNEPGLIQTRLVTPSLIPAHWNIGILHYKQAKLRKYMQHSVVQLFGQNETI